MLWQQAAHASIQVQREAHRNIVVRQLREVPLVATEQTCQQQLLAIPLSVPHNVYAAQIFRLPTRQHLAGMQVVGSIIVVVIPFVTLQQKRHITFVFWRRILIAHWYDFKSYIHSLWVIKNFYFNFIAQ